MKLVEKQLLGHLGNIKQFFWVSLVYITIIIYDYMIVSNHGQKLGLAPSGLGMGNCSHVGSLRNPNGTNLNHEVWFMCWFYHTSAYHKQVGNKSHTYILWILMFSRGQ